jgi:hypothetical protein
VLVLIVHKDAPINKLKHATVREIFLKRRQMWDNGVKIVPINLRTGDPLRQGFDRQFLELSPDQSASFWVKQRIRGKATPPREISSPGLVVRLVSTMRGAIAYTSLSRVTDRVRVLEINGISPTSRRYPYTVDGRPRGRPLKTSTVAAAVQVQTILKALSFDYNLSQRLRGRTTAAVLYAPGSAASKKVAQQVAAAFRELIETGDVDRKLLGRVTVLEVSDKDALSTQVRRSGIHLLYVGPGLSHELPWISAVSRSLQALTVASAPSFLDAGLALGVFGSSSRPKIHVNLRASEAEGVRFSSALLSMVKLRGK